jgi:alpha-L-rhamnosidase
MKNTLISLFFISSSLFSQQVKELNVPKVQYPCKKWDAAWITCPGIMTKDYNVLFFRKTFELNQNPDSFIIHVSADNHYFLYVNGNLITTGPARSDIRHWRYETVDIAKYLYKGKNIISAQVNNWSVYKGWSQFTQHTAFLLQGHSIKENMVNSDGSWKVLRSNAHRPNPVKWGDLPGYYGSYACDSIYGSDYPWEWQNLAFDDTKWINARRFDNAYNHDESNGYWMLTPRTVPLQEMTPENLNKIVRTENIQLLNNPFNGKDSLVIPKGQKVSILFDQQKMTIGYPLIEISGGKNAKIKITYAEALYYKSKVKGNRNDIKDKFIYGFNDVIVSGGGKNCKYTPLWLRPFRYVQLNIETTDEPLVINNFYNRYTTSPVELKSSFSCDDALLAPVWDACWRTDKICAQDFLMSDASWEQLQYIGDTRIHALTLLYMSGDDRLMRNAIEQFDYSRTNEGMLASNYPNDGLSIIPCYSLVWIDMIYDYMMNRGDRDFVAKFKMGIGNVLDWYESHLDSTGLLNALPYFNFTDWVNDGENGIMPTVKAGKSALSTMLFIYSLQHAVKIFEFVHENEKATHYKNISDHLRLSVFNQCWNSERSMMAENPLKNDFTQHTNILAVLTNTVSQPEYKNIMEKVMSGVSMDKTSIYYDFYLFEALKKAEMPEYFIKKLFLWKVMISQGLTTTPETFSKPRSDCHPWTTHPAFEMLTFLSGIEPTEPGFQSVVIRPQPGIYKKIQAALSLPSGMITINCSRRGSDGISGTVTLPKNMSGKFIWNNQEIELHEGEQKISIK